MANLFESVALACKEIGYRTSGTHLQEVASKYYGGPVNYTTACMYRLRVRRANQVEVDCRTYDGQPRRDMLNDNRCKVEGLKVIKTLCKKMKTSGNELATMFNTFHSIDQFKLHCQELDNLQLAA